MKKWAPLTERSSEDLRRCPCPSHSSGQVARAVQLTRSAQVSLDIPTCLCSLPPCPSSLEQGALWQLEQQRERWQEGTPRTREESTPRSLLPLVAGTLTGAQGVHGSSSPQLSTHSWSAPQGPGRTASHTLCIPGKLLDQDSVLRPADPAGLPGRSWHSSPAPRDSSTLLWPGNMSLGWM